MMDPDFSNFWELYIVHQQHGNDRTLSQEKRDTDQTWFESDISCRNLNIILLMSTYDKDEREKKKRYLYSMVAEKH